MATLLAAAFACGGREAPLSFTVRDSAGVRIAESAGPRPGGTAAWSIDPTPILDLATSGAGPPHEFYRVRDATRFADGGIVVADYASRQVRSFASTGRFLGSVGREGEGPGDFQRIRSVHRLPGDSVAVFDPWLRRITIFDRNRELGRIVSLFDDDLRPRWLGILDDTTLVTAVAVFTELIEVSGLVRERIRLVTLSHDGKTRDTLATVPGFESFEAPGISARALFHKDVHLATHGGRLYVGTADSMEYRVMTPDGATEHVVRVPGFDLQLTPEHVQDERDAIKASWPRSPPPRVVQIEEALPHPATRPAYQDLLVDAEGFVWVAEHHGFKERDDPTDWRLFSPDGEWLGSIRLPGRFTVFEIGPDYILGVQIDDMDVEHVQVLALER